MIRSFMPEAEIVVRQTPVRQRSLIESLFGGDKPNDEIPAENIEWGWKGVEEVDFVDLVNNNSQQSLSTIVKFHKNISSGTAVVRGTQPMSNDQYFWEVQMISPVYGTDMMVGVGTSEADISQVHDKFISLLGSDNKTWGLSYTGMFYHDGTSRDYSSRFGQGCIIGMHLDMWNGTLSFYKNKKHLGVASKGLNGKTLFAMASSTAACSGMRIVRSCSFPSSLQFLCCAKLRELVPDDKNVLQEVPIPPGLRSFLENNLSWLLDPRYSERISQRMNEASVSPRKRSHWMTGLDVFFEPVPLRFHSVLDENDSHQTSRNFLLVGNTACLLCNNRRSPGLTYRRRNLVLQPSTSNALLRASTSSPPTETSDKENTSQMPGGSSTSDSVSDVFDEEPGGRPESESKRRRRSYNYLIGLSDPDSD